MRKREYPGDDFASFDAQRQPAACEQCEGEGKICIGVEPMTYSGSGDSPRFRDRMAWCGHCDGTGIEPEKISEEAE